MFLPKNHPSVLRLPKHFVFALATLPGGCYLACYRGRYYSVTSTTLIISKKPGNTGKSRDRATEFTTKLLLLE